MISAVCKSPAEVFAHSLTSKLEHHLGNSDSAATADQGSRAWFARSRGLSAEMKGFPMPGTTFPPSNGIHFDLLRAKYHSESDLAVSQSLKDNDDLFRKYGGGEGGGGKDGDEGMDADGHDSDLFFDFDIDSPSEEHSGDEDGGKSKIHTEKIQEEKVLKRRNSVDSCISSRGGDLTKSSTAFGSVSSGLWSDMQSSPSQDEGATAAAAKAIQDDLNTCCLLYTSPSPRDRQKSRMPSSA